MSQAIQTYTFDPFTFLLVLVFAVAAVALAQESLSKAARSALSRWQALVGQVAEGR
ncbi:MAG TPA: hypothetical protein VMK05_17035 [Burkholderiales bacterium]|nr:hypothetical protein [Burkholderiales bacterium]